MKRTLLASLLLTLSIFPALAQVNPDNSPGLTLSQETSLRIPPRNRTMLCGPDTLLYSYLKEAFDAGLDTFYVDPLVGPNRAWSQGFLSGGTLTVTGVQFWGNVQDAANASQTIAAKVYLYSVDAAFMPIAKLDSATVTVGTAQTLYTGLFSAPVTVTGNYAVAVQNPVSTDTLAVIVNNGMSSTYGEGLAWRRFSTGVWNTAAFYAGQDLEPVIAPIVKYTMAADFTSSTTGPVCLGTPVSYTNMSSSTATLANRMYNYSVFADYWGGPGIVDSTYAWDMGDGNIVWQQSPTYAQTIAGTLNVSLVTISGLFTNCIDIKGMTLVVLDTAIAGFTADASGSPTVSFTNTSSNAVTYNWDFGDGSPNSTAANPSHTYPGPGTYTVTLTVTDANGCNTDEHSETVTLITIGMTESAETMVCVYPNPSAGNFFIENPTGEQLLAEIYNHVGERLAAQQVNGTRPVLDLAHLADGTYFIRVSGSAGAVTHRLVILR